ncbi:MAG: glycosyltransferase family 39 protein [Ktedonobacteraceae bacterium]|nr:glycosyltransferase family 39 protein [Ktedonobacteraceae bacterium]
MKTSGKPNKQETPPVAASATPPVGRGPIDRAPLNRTPEEVGNVTIFRTGQFFVHAFGRGPIDRAQPIDQLATINRAPTDGILSQGDGNTTFLERIRWFSVEQKRVVEAQTRLLPQVELINPVQKKEIAIPFLLEGIIVGIILLMSLVVHGYNMFNFPVYEVHEGTFMANAWAILHGQLEPYPYTYDHPPLGWIQIALWSAATGGFSTFGNALNSGRVLMLLFSLGSSVLIYLVANRLSGSRSAALLALVIFSLTTLGITYQREVVLDNIATFWLLLALYFVVVADSRMRFLIFAAVAFAVAVLSRGSFVVFFPAMLYAVWLHATTFQRKFAVLTFCYMAIALSSTFVLYAILKGELLPTGVLPWDHSPHPSLIGELVNPVQQSSEQGTFASSWAVWSRSMLPLMMASAVAVVMNLIGGWQSRMQWLVACFLISYWLFLLLMNTVFQYYVVALLPFLALNVVVAISVPLRRLSSRVGFDLFRTLLLFSMIGALIPASIQAALPVLTTQNATRAQTEALAWVRGNVPQRAVVIVNSYLYADLHDGKKVYPQAHLYWNAAFDPEIHDVLLHDDWNKIDYIVVDQHLLHDIRTLGAPMVVLDQALHHAVLRQEFSTTNGEQQTVVQIYQVVHVPSP